MSCFLISGKDLRLNSDKIYIMHLYNFNSLEKVNENMSESAIPSESTNQKQANLIYGICHSISQG